MKARHCVKAIVFFLFLIISHNLYAQEEVPNLLKIWRFTVKPNKVTDFENIIKELNAKDKKYKLSHSYYVSKSSSFNYSFIIQLEDYSDFDKYMESWNGIKAKMGEKHDALYKRWAETYDSYSTFFVKPRPDLSYIPEKPRLEEVKLFFHDVLYVKPDKVGEFEELLKNMKDLYKRKKVSEIVTIFSILGPDMPIFNAIWPAKNNIDHYTYIPKMWEILGEEGKRIFNKMMNCVRKREFRKTSSRPDLSYIVEK